MNAMTNVILMLLLSRNFRLVMPSSSSSSSAERVHIKVHMPEMVRQHTHFYKYHKPPAPPPLQLAKTLPAVLGKPSVTLLGYTTSPLTANGQTMHSLLQLLSMQQQQPMPLTPSALYPQSPALFNKLNLLAEEPPTLVAPPTSIGSSNKQQQPQLLQQLFTPNIWVGMQAARNSSRSSQENASTSLANNGADYFAALQQDFNNHKSALNELSTVSDMLKRKKYGRLGVGEQTLSWPSDPYQSSRSKPKTSNENNYLIELDDEEDFEDFAARQHDDISDDVVDMADVNTSMAGINGYSTGSTAPTAADSDSAVAFSGSSNSMTAALPSSINDWIDEWPSSNPQPATDLDSMYDAYAFSEDDQDNVWQPTVTDYVANRSATKKAAPKYLVRLQRWPKRHKAHGRNKRYKQSAPHRKRKIRLKLHKLHNIHNSLYYA